MSDLTGGQKWCPREVKRFWGQEARPCKSHPYLEKMGIGDPGGVRVIGDTLVIPMRTTRDWLVNLQLIDPGGRIEYLPGADVKGTFCAFGSVQRTNTVYICEGWATGWTIHDATASEVFAVFFRSELIPVATRLRGLYPRARLVFCAANQRWAHVEQEGLILPNPGVLAAFEASEHVGGQFVVPDFQDLHGRPTSFNDLRLREGREAVIRWLDPNQTMYAKDYLEGHDVLDAVCRARFPDSDASGQHVRAGALLCRVVDGLANTTESGTRGGLESARLLGSIGLQVAGDGLLVANRGGGWLHERLEDRWPDGRWKSLLRDLPDARATRPKYFTRSLTSRATSVPLRLLTHTVIVPSISAPNVSEIGRAEPGEEPRKAGRPAEAVERAAESRGGDAASARGGHRRGEPGGSGGAAGAGAVAARVPGREPAGPEGEEKKGS